MRSLLLSLLLGLSGCLLFFDDGGHRPDQCLTPETGAPIAQLPLRNPDTLECQAFGGGCDPACGPCPPQTQTDLAPLPSWGVCGSSCETLSESQCATASECRVVRDASCAVSGTCTTDFIGCFPVDGAVDPSVDCFHATSGWDCSRSAACTALHRQDPCPLATDAPCPRDFALCVPEGASPGKCHAEALCDIAQPACPPNTTAGVANGCYTGACIPNDLCEP